MKKTLLSFFFSCILHSAFAQTPNWLWAKNANAAYHDTAFAVAKDGNGNTYVAGRFIGTSITFGSIVLMNTTFGTSDMFVVKYDSSGNAVWAKSGGSNLDDWAKDVCLDAQGNVYVVGNCVGIIIDSDTGQQVGGGYCTFLVKFTPTGTPVYIRTIGASGNVYGCGVTCDSSGCPYITGYTDDYWIWDNDSLDYNVPTNSQSAYVIKYKTTGHYAWVKMISGNLPPYVFGSGISYSSTGYIYATGYFNVPVIIFDSYTVSNSGASGTNDMYLAKYNLNGSVMWARNAGGTGDDLSNKVASDANGNAFVVGSFSSASFNYGSSSLVNAGGWDVVTAKYDSSGTVLWAKATGGSSDDVGNNIALDAYGNSFITGSYQSSVINFGSSVLNNTNTLNDVFVMKYNNNGSEIWGKSAGGTDHDLGFGITIDPTSHPYIVGSFWSSSIMFGSTTLFNTGYGDAFIAKLDPDFVDGIGMVVLNTFNISPNPATSEIRIHNAGLKVERVDIYNVLGERVIDLTLNPSPKGEGLSVDVSALGAGIYFVKVRGEKGERVGKFVKE